MDDLFILKSFLDVWWVWDDGEDNDDDTDTFTIGLVGGKAVGSVSNVDIISLLDCNELIDVFVNDDVARFVWPVYIIARPIDPEGLWNDDPFIVSAEEYNTFFSFAAKIFFERSFIDWWFFSSWTALGISFFGFFLIFVVPDVPDDVIEELLESFKLLLLDDDDDEVVDADVEKTVEDPLPCTLTINSSYKFKIVNLSVVIACLNVLGENGLPYKTKWSKPIWQVILVFCNKRLVDCWDSFKSWRRVGVNKLVWCDIRSKYKRRWWSDDKGRPSRNEVEDIYIIYNILICFI